MTSAVTVRRILASETHLLRRVVLRDDSPTATVSFDGDDDLDTRHLGAFVADELVGIATFMARSCPAIPDAAPAVQLRGMAVSATAQSGGIGSILLGTAIDQLRADDCSLLWANARDSALGFYRDRFGMVVADDGFVDATTGIPHRRVWLHL